MVMAFLIDALIDEQVLKPGTYHEYCPLQKTLGGVSLDYMVLDAQALQHLEVVESSKGSEKGTLFDYVD